MIGNVTDDPTPEDLEQLAHSVAMSGVLGDRDRLDVVAALRRRSEVDAAKRRHPANGRRPNDYRRRYDGPGVPKTAP